MSNITNITTISTKLVLNGSIKMRGVYLEVSTVEHLGDTLFIFYQTPIL